VISAPPVHENTAHVHCLLRCPDDAATRAGVEDLAVSACEEARRRNSKAWARWTDDGLKVWFRDGRPEELRQLADSLGRSAPRYGASASFSDEEPTDRAYDIERSPILWGTVIHARLTRELLCALPEGAYVASDSRCSECSSSLGRVGPFSVRAQQWQRAQLAGLDGCVCRVLWSQDDFSAYRERSADAADSDRV